MTDRVVAGDPHEPVAAYALDALDERERAEFEAHLLECAACRDEVSSLQAAAAELAYAVDDAAPPPALRERTLAAARRGGDVVPLRRRWVLPAAGTVAALAACAALALGLWASSLAGDLDRERAARSASERAIALLADPDARRAALEGADGSLVVNASGEAVLALRSLARAPSGKTYEAWVIRGRAAPLPAGLFDAGKPTLFLLRRRVAGGAVVAVTVERAGGVAAPSGKPLFSARAPV